MNNKELITQLQHLADTKEGGRLAADFAARNRQILMSQINPLGAEPENSVFEYYNQYFQQTFAQYVVRPVGAMVVIVLVFLGYTATSTIASASLPGDLLYPVKSTTEKVQLALTFDQEEKIELHMDFVDRRTDELQQLVRIPNESDDKKSERVSEAVKNISNEVKSIQKNLDKISSDITSTQIVEVAKVVDTKTQEVSKEIVAAHASLPEAVQQQIAVQVNDVLANTEVVGQDALGVIVQKFEEGNTQVDATDVTNRVTERLKTAEENVAVVVSAASSTPAAMTMTLSVSASTTASATPAQAQQVIAEAKTLVDQKDFSSALVKIQESNTIVTNVVKDTQKAIELGQIVPIPASTTVTSTVNTSIGQ